MSSEENKNLVRRYQAAYNQNDLDALHELIDPDILTPKIYPGLPPGLEGAKAVHRIALLGMPDFHTEIEDLIAEEDKVVARVTISGIPSGNLLGVPATGKK